MFASGAPAVAIVLLLALKNLVLFGFFGTSSWGGNSLHRMMTESVDPAVVKAMVARGEISRLSLEWEFSPPATYVAILAPDHPNTGIPALDESIKTRTRENPVNYNHWVYPIASRAYFANAIRLVRAHPEAYLRSIAWTSRRFLDPVTDDFFVRPICFPVRRPIAFFEAAERSLVLRAVVAAALVWALVRLGRGRAPARERLFLAFAIGTVAWASASAILFEYGENNRFRYHLAPLLFLLTAIAARDWLRAARGRYARRRRASEEASAPATISAAAVDTPREAVRNGVHARRAEISWRPGPTVKRRLPACGTWPTTSGLPPADTFQPG